MSFTIGFITLSFSSEASPIISCVFSQSVEKKKNSVYSVGSTSIVPFPFVKNLSAIFSCIVIFFITYSFTILGGRQSIHVYIYYI